jgi:hypothetical protein
MGLQVNDVLMKLESGEINCDQALKEIMDERQAEEVYNNHFLHIKVNRVTDDHPRINVHIPLRMLKVGLDIGAVYATDLRGLDLHQLIWDLHALADGCIVEVEDYESDARVLMRVARMKD